jgi:modification target Cys-rich repeat protein
MNRKLRGLFYTIPGVLLGAAGATSCDKLAEAIPGGGEICGPCGTVASGDFSISGDAQLDGFFSAVGSLQNATASIQGDFEANILALAAVYNVNASAGFSAALVDQVIAAVKADIAANVQGSLTVNYKPPQCSADVNVSVQAQAQCEVKGGCDAQVTPGSVSVKCEGTCSGKCSGGCTGSASCVVKAPTVNCEGTCEGTCEMSAAATCSGTCHGTCSAGCSATDANGDCQGTCTGTCTGSCELKAAAKCTGTCHGSCVVEQGSAQCSAEAECRGSCDADCSGGCQGSVTPPNASASCDASAKCNAQASAQGSASLKCSPPSLDLSYGFQAGVTASGQANFVARLGEFKARGAAIVQGAARLTALVDGKIDGKVVINPSPLAQLKTSLEGFASAEAIGSFNIPPGRLPCVVPAFTKAVEGLGKVTTGVAGTISAQAKVVTLVTTGA